MHIIVNLLLHKTIGVCLNWINIRKNIKKWIILDKDGRSVSWCSLGQSTWQYAWWSPGGKMFNCHENFKIKPIIGRTVIKYFFVRQVFREGKLMDIKMVTTMDILAENIRLKILIMLKCHTLPHIIFCNTTQRLLSTINC